MPHTESQAAEISDTEESVGGAFSPAYVARLLGENVRLREENRVLWEGAITDRADAHFYKRMHRKAVERIAERDRQIEALKSKVSELQHRLFGRKSERGKGAGIGTKQIGPKRKRGQQPGTAGHGRQVQKELPVVEVEVVPPEGQTFCAHCHKPWEPFGEPEVSEEIQWKVRLFRRRTKRPKFRRPQGCTCQDGRADIVCAPVPASLIPKGLLGISFIVQALLLKFLHGMPVHRLLRMIEGEGMKLSAGTLCGVFQRIAPLFLPLYEGILACSRKQDLALGCVLNPTRVLSAPFVELDAERMKTPDYEQADKRLREAVAKMAAARQEELEAKQLRSSRRKVLESLQAHWHGLTLFVEHPQIPMDNNGAERAVRPAVIGRKNFYGSGAKWSGELKAMLMSLFQTLLLHQVDPRKYLTAYLQACADNGSQAPEDIDPWLPWNFSTPLQPSPQESGTIPRDASGPAP